jgi:hypothetical protein
VFSGAKPVLTQNLTERGNDMIGILRRLKDAEAMRDDAVEGEFWTWPAVGKSFRLFKFSDGRMRLIETSCVESVIKREPGQITFEGKDGLFHLAFNPLF